MGEREEHSTSRTAGAWLPCPPHIGAASLNAEYGTGQTRTPSAITVDPSRPDRLVHVGIDARRECDPCTDARLQITIPPFRSWQTEQLPPPGCGPVQRTRRPLDVEAGEALRAPWSDDASPPASTLPMSSMVLI